MLKTAIIKSIEHNFGGIMYPIIFSIGNVHVYSHGFFMIMGALIGGIVLFYMAKKHELETSHIFDLVIYSLLAGLIGARILYVTLYFNQFANFQEMIFVWYGGLVSYGGMAGGLLAAYWILKRKKENILKWFDIGIIATLIAWSIGRIGCLLNNDSFGILSDSAISIWGRIPIQIFESVWCVIAASILYFIYNNQKKLNLNQGFIFFFGLALYAIGRFVIDFWRDEEKILINLNLSQLGSLLIFFIIIYALNMIRLRKEVILWFLRK